MKPIMGTLGQVGRMSEYGRNTVMELHGRVYLNGHYMAEMTFNEACNVARYRHSTEPQNVTEVDTGRFTWAMALFVVSVIFLIAAAVIQK